MAQQNHCLSASHSWCWAAFACFFLGRVKCHSSGLGLPGVNIRHSPCRWPESCLWSHMRDKLTLAPTLHLGDRVTVYRLPSAFTAPLTESSDHIWGCSGTSGRPGVGGPRLEEWWGREDTSGTLPSPPSSLSLSSKNSGQGVSTRGFWAPSSYWLTVSSRAKSITYQVISKVPSSFKVHSRSHSVTTGRGRQQG